MKGIIKVSKMKYPELPQYKTRSEFETEKILNKYKAIARKRQIQLQIIDNEIKPYSISTYMIPQKRKNIFKLLGSILRHLLLSINELRP